jgi:hypothetical protein
MESQIQAKKKKWPWIVGGILLLGLIGSLSGQKPNSSPDTASVQPSEEKSGDAASTMPSSVSKTYQEIFSVKGKGNSNSETFATTGGKLKIVARTWGGKVGTYSAIALESEDGRYLSNASLSISTSGSDEGKGETIIRDAKAGTYFISAISGVEWEVHVFEEK